MKIFRGDTFKFDFSAYLENGTIHTFQAEDILKVGMKANTRSSEYILYQEKQITEQTDVVTFEFTHEEMIEATLGEKLLEIELTDTSGRVSTLYQEEIIIVGDVINE